MAAPACALPPRVPGPPLGTLTLSFPALALPGSDRLLTEIGRAHV